MAFKRALWHSGLSYQQTCHTCSSVIKYTDYDLDFRPWYADGFVYCPKCRTPLRHSENFALNADGTPAHPAPEIQNAPAAPAPNAAFCSNCGKQYVKGTDHFCSGCGTKLD